MKHEAMTGMDRAVWMMVGGQNSLEIENASRDADRKDAMLMRSAQILNLARAIATRGKPESEAIQVR